MKTWTVEELHDRLQKLIDHEDVNWNTRVFVKSDDDSPTDIKATDVDEDGDLILFI